MFIFYVCILCLFSHFSPVRGSADVQGQLAGMKRSAEVEGTRLVKRTIYFASPCAWIPQNYPDVTPDLLEACNNVIYAQRMAPKYQDFVRCFRIAKYAYEVDFLRTGLCDFELTRWEGSSIVERLNFNIHLEFLVQLFKPKNLPKLPLSSPLWELYTEYIHYVFNRVDRVDYLPGNTFIKLLLPNISLLVPQIFRAIIKYSPEQVSQVNLGRIWAHMIHVASVNKISVMSRESASTRWFELFYLITKRYGAFVVVDDDIKVPVYQALCAAMAQHHPEALREHFRTAVVTSSRSGLGDISHWVDRILEFDEDFKYPKASESSESSINLSRLADGLFDSIKEFCVDFFSFLSFCLNSNLLHLAQFLLMYSDKARAEIPSKRTQCLLLVNLVRVSYFDFDYHKFVTVIVGFGLTLSDIDEFLLAELEENYRAGSLVQALRFILQVVHSAPDDLLATTTWTPPSDPISVNIDTQNPFLFDAGRIILAQRFKIAPVFTKIDIFGGEEVCYRDLAWFMSFFVNILRPDLGSEYEIKIERNV